MPTFIRAGIHIINLASVAYVAHVPADWPEHIPKTEHLILHFCGGHRLVITDPTDVKVASEALRANTRAV